MNWLGKYLLVLVLAGWLLVGGDGMPARSADTSGPSSGQELVAKKDKDSDKDDKKKKKKKDKDQKTHAERSASQVA
ncbi:hypothetical protein AYO44_04635 [Planctomycetaceae bacterium SCGC AG-212-F19]|nr:hypothetical protein AYO44_04635 [Planctomycetaceae bacterium SCGC AG-212-F19]